jgi:hypothetical protein
MDNSKIKNLKKRHAKEKRFKLLGMISIGFSLAKLLATDSSAIRFLVPLFGAMSRFVFLVFH